MYLIGLVPTNHTSAYITMAYQGAKQCKIFEISLTESQILKKLQTLAIIWEISDSNLETRRNGSKLGVSGLSGGVDSTVGVVV